MTVPAAGAADSQVVPCVLSFNMLEGVAFPRLLAQGVLLPISLPADVAALSERARAGIRVLITNPGIGCSAEVMSLLPDLRVILSLGAGTDRVDHAVLAQRGIVLHAIGEALTEDVADLAMAMTVMTARNLQAAGDFVRDGQWQRARFAPGRSLVGATMGIAGLGGRIGQALARRALASRMQVIGLDRPSARQLGHTLLPDMVSLARQSDVLVLCLPGGPALRHVVDYSVLNALGPEGTLINVGRGELVDTDALMDALENNRIAAAGLDVIEGEPRVPARLAAMRNVVLTPHIGGSTWGARARVAALATDKILTMLKHDEQA